jgi:hypothetical protein
MLGANLRALDAAPLSLRPADEAGVEDPTASFLGQHFRHGGCLVGARQGVVALAMLYLVARGVLGIFAPIKHEQTLLGSSVDEALKHGGTKTGPMQA